MSILKRIGKFFVVQWLPLIALVGIAYFLISRWPGSFSPAKWFKQQPVQIDETPLVISKIRELALLQTAKLYCEVITDSVVVTSNDLLVQGIRNAIISPFIPVPPAPSKELVIIAKGQVIAGMDLAGLSDKDLIINGDTAKLMLPASKILEVISNPSDVEVFSESGVWNSNEIILVKQKAIGKMKEEAENRNLLKMADDRAIILMENFLKAAGFTVPIVEIKY